ncbi:hypothetical protein JMM61_05095 [Rhodovulum sulfidophilum]|nr:hypothetical protein [Rhodovulum sulfidophilum]
MSRKGDCLDNAPMESFFGSLKNEQVHRTRFRPRRDAKAALFEDIAIFYSPPSAPGVDPDARRPAPLGRLVMVRAGLLAMAKESGPRQGRASGFSKRLPLSPLGHDAPRYLRSLACSSSQYSIRNCSGRGSGW